MSQDSALESIQTSGMTLLAMCSRQALVEAGSGGANVLANKAQLLHRASLSVLAW